MIPTMKSKLLQRLLADRKAGKTPVMKDTLPAAQQISFEVEPSSKLRSDGKRRTSPHN